MSYSHEHEPIPKHAEAERIQVTMRDSRGHCRTPAYIRGKIGVIERYCGNFENPEQIAVAHPAPVVIPLYRCRFLQKDVWPDYCGADSDTLELEVYEHWLEAI